MGYISFPPLGGLDWSLEEPATKFRDNHMGSALSKWLVSLVITHLGDL